MNKVIDISLIENIDKKKKTHNKEVTLLEYKKKVINDLEDVITLKFFEHKNPIEIKQTDDFINIRNEMGLNLPTVRVSFLETADNKHEMKDFINFWENKVDYVTIQQLIQYEKTPEQLKSNNNKDEIVYNCHQPWQRVTIRSNGDIKPCCAVPGMAFNYPNVNDISIYNFWNGKIMKKLRNQLKDGEGYKNEICKACIESVSNKNN